MSILEHKCNGCSLEAKCTSPLILVAITGSLLVLRDSYLTPVWKHKMPQKLVCVLCACVTMKWVYMVTWFVKSCSLTQMHTHTHTHTHLYKVQTDLLYSISWQELYTRTVCLTNHQLSRIKWMILFIFELTEYAKPEISVPFDTMQPKIIQIGLR